MMEREGMHPIGRVAGVRESTSMGKQVTGSTHGFTVAPARRFSISGASFWAVGLAGSSGVWFWSGSCCCRCDCFRKFGSGPGSCRRWVRCRAGWAPVLILSASGRLPSARSRATLRRPRTAPLHSVPRWCVSRGRCIYFDHGVVRPRGPAGRGEKGEMVVTLGQVLVAFW